MSDRKSISVFVISYLYEFLLFRGFFSRGSCHRRLRYMGSNRLLHSWIFLHLLLGGERLHRRRCRLWLLRLFRGLCCWTDHRLKLTWLLRNSLNWLVFSCCRCVSSGVSVIVLRSVALGAEVVSCSAAEELGADGAELELVASGLFHREISHFLVINQLLV